MFFWMVLGTLLLLALLVAVIWLLMRAFRSQKTPSEPPWQPQGPQPYQQGSHSTVPESETYHEGGQTYPYPEQPSAIYPQRSFHQEQRPRSYMRGMRRESTWWERVQASFQ